jgi:conjugal transfer ATP-binding protein TraC
VGDLLPYGSYDRATGFFYNTSSTGFILEFPPLVGATAETEKELSLLFQHTLPEGSSIQFILWADPKIDLFLAAFETSRAPGTIFERLAQERMDFIRVACHQATCHDATSHGVKSHQSFRNFRCIVSVAVKGLLERPEAQEFLYRLKDQVTTTFQNLGLPVLSWDPQDLLGFLNDILCFKAGIETKPVSWNPYDLLSDQVGRGDSLLQVTPEALLVDEGRSRIKSYQVTRFPEAWALGGMGELLGDMFRDPSRVLDPFLIHYGVHVIKDPYAKSKLLAKASHAEKQARSLMAKYLPSLQRQVEEHTLIRAHLEQGERLLKTRFTVTLFSPQERLASSEQTLLSHTLKSGWELTAPRYTQLQTLLSTLPLMWGEGMEEELGFFSSTRTTLSVEAPNLLPIQGEWKGTSTPGIFLVGRRGQVFTWSPFDNDSGNYNVCVVGRSGSGKSVFMQEMMTGILSLSGRVFVLDVGRSFEKSCRLMGGDFMAFSSHAPLCINPFTSLQGLDEDGITDGLSMLKSILSVMASPTQGTSDLENAFLEQALSTTWARYGHKATISHIASSLDSQGALGSSDPRAKDLALKLFPYTSQGLYGRFFEGEATLSFSNALSVIELEELKERKDLQAVIVQMVILNITNQMFLGDRKTPFGIIFDEAWDMLRGPQSGLFIETLARRLRKYRGSLIVGTQSIHDFYASPGAQAAFDNADWMCLFSQKQEAIDQMKKTERMSLTPQREALLASLKTRQGAYAEVMISGPPGYAIGRVILDPFSNILYSTKAEDFTAVKSLMEGGLSVVEALEEVAYGPPKGRRT